MEMAILKYFLNHQQKRRVLNKHGLNNLKNYDVSEHPTWAQMSFLSQAQPPASLPPHSAGGWCRAASGSLRGPSRHSLPSPQRLRPSAERAHGACPALGCAARAPFWLPVRRCGRSYGVMVSHQSGWRNRKDQWCHWPPRYGLARQLSVLLVGATALGRSSRSLPRCWRHPGQAPCSERSSCRAAQAGCPQHSPAAGPGPGPCGGAVPGREQRSGRAGRGLQPGTAAPAGGTAGPPRWLRPLEGKRAPHKRGCPCPAAPGPPRPAPPAPWGAASAAAAARPQRIRHGVSWVATVPWRER